MKELSESFETTESGKAILKQDAPAWCINAVHAAHEDMLPDDFKEAICKYGSEILADYDSFSDMRDAVPGVSESLTDVYSRDLYCWLSSNITRQLYVNSAVNETGLSRKPFDLTQVLMGGQQAEIKETLYLLIDAVEELS